MKFYEQPAVQKYRPQKSFCHKHLHLCVHVSICIYVAMYVHMCVVCVCARMHVCMVCVIVSYSSCYVHYTLHVAFINKML